MKEFKKDLKKAKRILITSHINCDPDGVTSALATKLIIEKNLENNVVEVNIESELPTKISFLKSFSKIKKNNLIKEIKEFKPDTIIFTDGQTPERFTKEKEELIKTIKNNSIKTIIIDHHDSATTLKTNYHFNDLRSSCAEEIYFLFVKNLKFEIDSKIAEVILTGMIYDTGVFKYKNKHFRDTANTVADLVEYGAVVEDILRYKNQYTLNNLKIMNEFNKNLKIKEDFCWTYIDNKILIKNKEFNESKDLWIENIYNNIENIKWGFIIYPSKTKDEYKISIRSKQNGRIVKTIAEKFNGGGHDHASGFTMKGKNIKQIINTILQNI